MLIIAMTITQSRSSFGPTMPHPGTLHIIGSNWLNKNAFKSVTRGARVRGQDIPPACPTIDQRQVHRLATEPPPDPRKREQGLTADLNIELAPM